MGGYLPGGGTGGGGSTTFTGLTDTPATISSNMYVRGNADGSGLIFSAISGMSGFLRLTELTATITPTLAAVAGTIYRKNGTGDISVTLPDPGSNPTEWGQPILFVNTADSGTLTISGTFTTGESSYVLNQNESRVFYINESPGNYVVGPSDLAAAAPAEGVNIDGTTLQGDNTEMSPIRAAQLPAYGSQGWIYTGGENVEGRLLTNFIDTLDVESGFLMLLHFDNNIDNAISNAFSSNTNLQSLPFTTDSKFGSHALNQNVFSSLAQITNIASTPEFGTSQMTYDFWFQSTQTASATFRRLINFSVLLRTFTSNSSFNIEILANNTSIQISIEHRKRLHLTSMMVNIIIF